jgi:hypothetical protein
MNRHAALTADLVRLSHEVAFRRLLLDQETRRTARLRVRSAWLLDAIEESLEARDRPRLLVSEKAYYELGELIAQREDHEAQMLIGLNRLHREVCETKALLTALSG